MTKIKSHNIFILTGLFASLTAVGAYLKIPLPSVPVTLQTFFVYLSANVLGTFYGTISQIIYLFIGLIGIPVFAYGGGLGYFLHPTFGFLLSYPFSVFLVGNVLRVLKIENYQAPQKSKGLFVRIFIADLIGLAFIFLIGTAYLYLNLRWGLYLKLNNETVVNIMNWNSLFQMTLFIFIPIDLIKVGLASFVSTKIFQKYNYKKIVQAKSA